MCVRVCMCVEGGVHMLLHVPKHQEVVCLLGTVDREIFTVKIIHVLNFHIKNISLLTGSAM